MRTAYYETKENPQPSQIKIEKEFGWELPGEGKHNLCIDRFVHKTTEGPEPNTF